MHCPITMLSSDTLSPALLNKITGEKRSEVLAPFLIWCFWFKPYPLKEAFIFSVSAFLVSELEAARILECKAAHPDDQSSAGKTELEQRVEEPTHQNTELCQSLQDCEVHDMSMRREEMSAEFALLLQALDMDASSQYADVLQEVRLMLNGLQFN